MRRAMPATVEPAMMEVRDEERDEAEVRRAVTIGVTIWERNEISNTFDSKNGVRARPSGQLRPRKEE
jgi:hypothetical protein